VLCPGLLVSVGDMLERLPATEPQTLSDFLLSWIAPRRVKLSLWALMIVFGVGTPVLLMFNSHGQPGEVDPAIGMQRTLESCVKNLLEATDQTHPTAKVYTASVDVCLTEIFNINSLIDFNYRRHQILNKELDEQVLLWMVVSVTVSGVLLAGLQLLASYRLASTGQQKLSQPSQLSIQRGRLSIKSSVTGLIILTISLAFFVVYVKWIYPDQIAEVQPAEMKQVRAPGFPDADLLPFKGHLLEPAEERGGGVTPGKQ
jgi:hypothetical protein